MKIYLHPVTVLDITDFMEKVAEELLTRMLEQAQNDERTGEHADATLYDYLQWASEELNTNQPQ